MFLLMSFDNPDLDYDPLQDEDDFGLGIMSNVGDIHDALDEPPPDFWDEMLNEPDEYADDERNDIVPDQQYFSWSDAVARDAVDVSQPHVFDGSSRDSTGIAKSAVPATSTARRRERKGDLKASGYSSRTPSTARSKMLKRGASSLSSRTREKSSRQ